MGQEIGLGLSGVDTGFNQIVAKPEIATREPLHTPYYHALHQEADAFFRQHPESNTEESLQRLWRAMQAIDAEQLQNLRVYSSNKYSDIGTHDSLVEFPYSQIRISPHMINYIVKGGGEEYTPQPLPEGRIASDTTTYALFPAFAQPDDTLFSVGDVTFDRVMRLLGHAARHPNEDVRVILMGTPLMLGGNITQAFVDAVRNKQFGKKVGTSTLEPYGKISAELLAQLLPEHVTEDTRIVLQGASKGTEVAVHTSQALPQQYQAQIQRLLDVPPVPHRTERQGELRNSIKIVGGLIAEVGKRTGDAITKVLVQHGKQFSKDLQAAYPEMQRKGKRKLKAALAEIGGITRDTLQEDTVRSFVRRGIDDPLTGSKKQNREIARRELELLQRRAERLTEIRLKGRAAVDKMPEARDDMPESEKEALNAARAAAIQRNQEVYDAILQAQVIPVLSEGKAASLYTPIKGRHFYDTYMRFGRWAKQLAHLAEKQHTA